MAIVSLRKYLAGTEDSNAYRRAVGVLIHGIVESAVCIDQPDHKLFVDGIEKITAAAAPDCGVDDLLVISGSVIQSLQDYNTRTTGLLRKQGAEFQNMLSMMAQTVNTISGGTGKSVEALHDLRRGLESAALLEDVQKVKARLGDCLRSVCEEVQRQKTEAETLVTELQRQIDRGQTVKSAPEDDRVTGLPRRHAAEETIRQALLISGRKYLVTAVVDRLQSLNARFGQEVGDAVLRSLARRIQENLGDSDVLFRWNGPTIVAMVWREENIEQVRRTAKHIFDTPLEREFDIGGRQVLIPISAAWSVIGLIPPAINSFNYIDRFVASQSPKDFA